MDELKVIEDIYNRLLILLKSQNNTNLHYIITQIEKSIEILDEGVRLGNKMKQEEILHSLGKIYRNINQPRVGLSDYFIWRDDYGERMKANESLYDLKNNLFEHLNKYR